MPIFFSVTMEWGMRLVEKDKKTISSQILHQTTSQKFCYSRADPAKTLVFLTGKANTTVGFLKTLLFLCYFLYYYLNAPAFCFFHDWAA